MTQRMMMIMRMMIRGKRSMEMMAQSWSNLLCIIFPAENANVMAIPMETESDVVNMGIYDGSQQMMTS